MRIVIYRSIYTCLFLFGCVQTGETLNISEKILDEHSEKGILNRNVIIKNWEFGDDKLINIGQFHTRSLGGFSYAMKKKKDAYFYHFSLVNDLLYPLSTQEIVLAKIKFISFRLNKLACFSIKSERNSKTPTCYTLYVSWKANSIDCRTLFLCKLINFSIVQGLEFRLLGNNVESTAKHKVYVNKNFY